MQFSFFSFPEKETLVVAEIDPGREQVVIQLQQNILLVVFTAQPEIIKNTYQRLHTYAQVLAEPVDGGFGNGSFLLVGCLVNDVYDPWGFVANTILTQGRYQR